MKRQRHTQRWHFLTFVMALTFCMVHKTQARGLYTNSDGLGGLERATSYFSLDGGGSGLLAPLEVASKWANQASAVQARPIDYFLRIWVRPAADQQLMSLIEVPNVLRCGLGGGRAQCRGLPGNQTVSVDFRIELGNTSFIPFNTWVHISFSGSVSQNLTYLRLDTKLLQAPNRSTSIPYLPITRAQLLANPLAYLGTSQNSTGGFFRGDLREFIFANQYVPLDMVEYVKNQVISWNVNQLANYRLTEGSLKDWGRPFSPNTQLLESKLGMVPTWDYDSATSVDMCMTQQTWVELPRINTDMMSISQGRLDSRLQPTQNFVYTASFWMKTLPGIRTTVNPQIARSDLSFFDLDEVFALWFFDPTSVRIFFHSVKSFNEYGGQVSVYFPLGQWANIQIQIDRLVGYEMRVYDMQRREVARARENIFIEDQAPTRIFTLVRNFQGYIKQIMLYNTKLSLPVDQTNGNFDVITNSQLLIYYKFDREYFRQTANETIFTLPSLAQNVNQAFGPTLTLSGNLTFDRVEWDATFNFSQPSLLGSLSQTQSLFDGITCKKYQDLVQRFQTLTQNITVSTNITEGTVELWFKNLNGSLEMPFNMIELISQNANLSLGVENGIMTCRVLNYRVVYNIYRQNNTQWQHMACTFQSGYDLQGSIFASDLTFFKTEVRDIVLPIGNYSLNLNASGRVLLKELRVWKQARSMLEIESYRWRQIDPRGMNQIFVYYRLADSSLLVTDYAQFFRNQCNCSCCLNSCMSINQTFNSPVISIELAQFIKPSPLLLCPVNTYKQPDSTCSLFPLSTHPLYLLPTRTSTPQLSNSTTDTNSETPNTTSVLWTLSTTSSLTQTSLQPLWTLRYSNRTQFSSNYTVQLATIPSDDDQLTNATQALYDRASMNLVSQASIEGVFPSQGQESCFVMFNETGTARVEVYVLDDNKTVQYQLNTSQCASQEDDMEVIWLDTDLVEMDDSWMVKIKKQKLAPSYQITEVAGEVRVAGKFQHHLVLSVQRVERVQPNVTVINPLVLMGEDVVIDGSKSLVWIGQNTTTTAGITYYWNCPDPLRPVCESQTYKRYLSIPYKSFSMLTNDKFSTPLNFTLQVFKANQPTPNLSLLPASSLNLTWLPISRPQIRLQAQSPIKVNQSAEFELIYMNYPFDSSDLEPPQWKISDTKNASWTLNQEKVSRSIQGDLLMMSPGTFQSGREYEVMVKVRRMDYEFAEGVTKYTFKTGMKSPTGGEVTMFPFSGTMGKTEFSFSITNWISPSNLTQKVRFRIIGNYNQSTITLTDREYSQSEFFRTKLPLLQSITFEIFNSDSLPEMTQQTIQLTPLAVDTDLFTQSPLDTPSSLKLKAFSIMSNTTLYGPARLSMLNQLKTIANATTEGDYGYIIANLTFGLENLKQSRLEVCSAALDVVEAQYRIVPTGIMLQVLSNVMQGLAGGQSGQAMQPGLRGLQGVDLSQKSMMRRARELKAKLIELACSGSISQESAQVSTKSFDIIFESIDGGTLEFERTLINSKNYSDRLVVPIRSIKEQIGSYCQAVSFYNSNIFLFESFTNQTVGNTSSLIEHQLVLLPFQNTSAKFSLSLSLAYPYNQTLSGFKHNQTALMQLPMQNLSLWAFDACTTSYGVLGQLLRGTCDTVLHASTPNTTTSLITVYAIVTDSTRTLIIDFPKKYTIFQLLDAVQNFDEAVSAVLIILVAFNVLMPILGVCMDRLSYGKIKEMDSEERGVVEGVARSMGVPVEMVVYQRHQYRQYAAIQDTKACTMFRLYMKNQHPFLSFFSRFDAEHKRLARFIQLSLQLSIVSVATAIIYSYDVYRRELINDPKREQMGSLDMKDLEYLLISGFILSVLTLPLPETMTRCLRSKLVLVSHKQDEAPINVGDIVLKDKGAQNTGSDSSKGGNTEDTVVIENLESYGVCCKLLLLLFTLMLASGSVLVVAFVSAQAHKANSESLTISFFITLLVGNVVLNPIRLAFNALFAPSVGKRVTDEEGEEDVGCCAAFFLSPDSIQIMKDIIMVHEVLDSLKAKQDLKKRDVDLTSSPMDQDRGPPSSHNKIYSGITSHKLISQTDRTHLDDNGAVNDFGEPQQTIGEGKFSLDGGGKRGFSSKYRKPSQIDLINQQDYETTTKSVERGQESRLEEGSRYSMSVRRRRAKERSEGLQAEVADIVKPGRRRQRRQRFQDDSIDPHEQNTAEAGSQSNFESRDPFQDQHATHSRHGKSPNNLFSMPERGPSPHNQDSPTNSWRSIEKQQNKRNQDGGGSPTYKNDYS